MLIPELNILDDFALLLLRIITALVFFSSGWSHMNKPKERGQSIGMSKTFTFFLGLGEVLGAIGIISGVLISLSALVLIVIMIGAISKKILVWKTGFFAQKGYGWHYDLLLLASNLVIVSTGGGAWVVY